MTRKYETHDGDGMAIEGATVLPDGTAFFTASMPLPDNHWLYEDKPNVPPMPMRVGTDNPFHAMLAEQVREAGKYAVRCATMNGKDPDFDPDALVQNLIVGLLGYWTPDGLCHESWADPDPVPPLLGSAGE